MKHFKTISAFHQFRGLPKPQHPLISIFSVDNIKHLRAEEPESLSFDFYSIALKRVHNARMKYGQQAFDFNEGIMSFMAPNQVFSIAIDQKEEEFSQTGWVIYIHPDFLWNTGLAKIIKRYDFWSYSLNEALFLSEKEEAVIGSLIQNMEQEYQANIDRFSKPIIISQLETLLNYAERFYNRQFITREKTNHQLLERLEALINFYFDQDDLINKGLPTVRDMAVQLNLSPKYLSSLLVTLTGKSTQQFIHDRLIEKAKEKLSTTNLSVGEIAYGLGFEHIQSFSKFFKTKTSQSPLEFRQSFN